MTGNSREGSRLIEKVAVVNMTHLAGAASVPVSLAPDAGRVAGTPESGSEALSSGSVELGIWEITPGVVRDIESDELFLVLSGCASIRALATDEVTEVAPGDLVRLREGAETEWVVHETLRKVYVTALE